MKYEIFDCKSTYVGSITVLSTVFTLNWSRHSSYIFLICNTSLSIKCSRYFVMMVSFLDYLSANLTPRSYQRFYLFFFEPMKTWTLSIGNWWKNVKAHRLRSQYQKFRCRLLIYENVLIISHCFLLCSSAVVFFLKVL